MERQMSDKIRDAIGLAIERGEIPGAVALVNWRGRDVFRESFGFACLEPAKVPMRPDHRFDLASLTKVVATTTAILILRDEGALNLDGKLGPFLPELRTPGKEDITIHHCLTHTSGLPAFRKYYNDINGKEAYLRAIASESLETDPGTARKYSDLGFILLGFAVEAIAGEGLADFTRRKIFAPLGMEHTGFIPVSSAERSAEVFAATEFRPSMNQRLLAKQALMVGEVHDENAYALGGVAGHAGLFSTADDLARFGQMLMGKGETNGARILSPESVSLLNRPQVPEIDPEAGLGWRIRSREESALGFLASPRSFGHTGFTGTTLWIDPDNRVVAVLLTNAIHPSREKANTGPVRLEFHQAVAEATRCVRKSGRPAVVKTGLDILEGEGFKRLHECRVAVVTNHTAIDANREHLLDLLARRPEVKVTALFGPEHGIRGAKGAGEHVADSTEGAISVYSLYGARRKPTEEMGKDFDVMLYDIQDVGTRFYTYIWTMFTVQQYCAETGKKLIVLDRPNPLGGRVIEGPVLDEKYASFVGLKPIPIRYGLTIGELAILFNKMGWLGQGLEAELEVVAMEGWERELWFDETGLPWIAPSPAMPTLDTAIVYPGACFLEATGWSEGRGTLVPFEYVGGPEVDPDGLARALNEMNLPGCRFLPVRFTPRSTFGAPTPKHRDKECGGVFIRVDDRETFRAVQTGLAIVMALRKNYPSAHQSAPARFDRLAGTSAVREMMDAGASLETIVGSWAGGLKEFDAIRRTAMLY